MTKINKKQRRENVKAQSQSGFRGGGQSSLSSPGGKCVKEWVNDWKKVKEILNSHNCGVTWQLTFQNDNNYTKSCHPEKAEKSIERREIRFLPCSGSQKTAPSPKLGEGRGEVTFRRFLLASWANAGSLTRQDARGYASLRMTYKKKYAFTLAEVLITLGIIGVVAAMTMPALMAKYQRSVVETRLAKFYSTINQAIQRSEVDNGDRKEWDKMIVINNTGTLSGTSPENGISAEEWYHKYLEKYIKVIKAEPSSVGEQKFNLYFPDGSMVTFSGTSWIFYPDAKNYIEITDEESGIVDRNRDDAGKTNFTFFYAPYKKGLNQFYNKGVEPYVEVSVAGNNTTDEKLKNNASTGCYVNNPTNERAYCTELIRRNGWKIPKDYPWLK